MDSFYDTYCKRCGHKLTALFTSSVCDYCDPPKGAPSPTKSKQINWWEDIWWQFIGGTKNPTLSKLNPPLHTSQVGNLSNGVARAVVLFWPNGVKGAEDSKDAVVFDVKSGQYQYFQLLAPAKEVHDMPGMPSEPKYVHDLDTSTPFYGQFATKWCKMIILKEGPPPNKTTGITPKTAAAAIP